MSKHYEERYYSRDEMRDSFDEDRRSNSRRRSSSRSRRGPPADEQYYRRGMDRSGSGSSISSMASDYEYRTHCVGERPMVRAPRDVIRAPTPPPVIQRVVERAPTPEPDIVERVIVRPQPQQLIERIIERPRTPPPRIIDKEICEPAPPPIVRTRIVKVDHSAKHYSSSGSRYGIPSSRSGVYTYSPVEYDCGYDDSYSTSYSTSELYPPQNYNTYASPSIFNAPPPPPPPPITNVSYQPAAPNMGMNSQPGYAPTAYSTGFSYGYRAPNMQGYPGPSLQHNGHFWLKKINSDLELIFFLASGEIKILIR
ncbi:hypothetical protein BpHYR1_012062 [Brachionus plicatilis]|uniref:Uncharacterized protein n=1 Tax=Brachionus plicatilis TaxID=10195 RepID=A0A3M7SST1_BRAPC|nr:hypothetical protein BpHYR1_012062 [Brachionus plicatilis]